MAKRGEKSDRERGFSLPRTVAKVAPIGAGAYYSARRMMEQAPLAAAQAQVSPHPVTGFIQDIAPYADKVATEQARIKEFLDFAATHQRTRFQETLAGSVIKQDALTSAEVLAAWKRAAEQLPEPFRHSLDPSKMTDPMVSMRNVLSEFYPKLSPTYQKSFSQVFKSNINLAYQQRAMLGDAYDPSVLQAAATPSVVPGVFTTRPMPGIQALPAQMRPYAQRLQETMGDIGVTWRTHAAWEQAGMGTWDLTAGKFKMSVPQSVGGTILTGGGLESRFAVGQYGVWDEGVRQLQKMNYEEYFMYRMERDIAPQVRAGVSTRQVQRSIDQLSQQIRQPGQYLPSAPPQFQLPQTKGFTELRGSTMHLVTPEGQAISASAAQRIPELREHIGVDLMPGGVSPSSMAKGTMSTTDVRGLFRAGEFAQESRSLYQAFREWGPERAPEGVGADFSWVFSPKLKELYGETPGVPYAAVFVKPGEMKQAQKRSLSDLAVVAGDGEWEITRSLADQSTMVRDHSLRLHQMNTEMANLFIEEGGIGRAKATTSLPKGALVGWHEGRPVTLSNPVRVKGFTRHGDAMRLHVEEIMALGQAEKAFGTKGSMIRRGARVFEETQDALRLPFTPQARIPIDVLKKEPHMLATQMTSALWHYARGMPTDRVAPYKTFLQHPGEVMDRLAAGGIEQYTRSMMSMAEDIGLPTREWGRVFGGVPEFFGEDWAERLGVQLSRRKRSVIGHQSPIGAGFFTSGGLRSHKFTVGGRASIEPRIFQTLQAGQFGGLGSKLSTELVHRLAQDSPEAVLQSEEVRRTLASFVGDADPSWSARKMTAKAFTRGDFERFAEGGGWLEVGAGRPDVYVPSMERVRAMAPMALEEGRTAYTKFYREFVELGQAAADLQSGRMTQERFLAEGGPYLKAMRGLQKDHAIFGKGLMGLARGKTQRVHGSRWLQIASTVGAPEAVEAKFRRTAGLFDVGIGDRWFEEMLQERAQFMAPEELGSLKKRWLAGEAIGGVGWRHPFIGEYSALPLRFRRVEQAGVEPLAMFAERTVQIAGKDVSLSPLSALLADKDGDFSGLMLLHGDAEKASRDWLRNADNQQVQRYVANTVQMQLLKPKAASAADEMANLTVKQLSEVATEKLSLAKERVPYISVAMTRAKRAVAGMGKDPRAASALSLLTILEQTPIGGKHVSGMDLAANIRSLEVSLEGIGSAIDRGDARGIEFHFRKILGNKTLESDTVQGMLGSGIDLTDAEHAAAQKYMGDIPMPKHIPGLELPRTSEFLAEAAEKYKAAPGARMDELLTGRAGRVSLSEVAEYIKKANISAEGVTAGVKSQGFLSKMALTAKNFAGVHGRKMFGYAKPLLLGTGAAVGISALLSRPKDIVGSGAQFAPQDTYLGHPGAAATGLRPEDVLPPQEVMGAPTAPTRLASPSVRIGSNVGYNVNAHVGMEGGDMDMAEFSRQVEMATGGADRVNVNMMDRRRTQSADELLNDIYYG